MGRDFSPGITRPRRRSFRSAEGPSAARQRGTTDLPSSEPPPNLPLLPPQRPVRGMKPQNDRSASSDPGTNGKLKLTITAESRRQPSLTSPSATPLPRPISAPLSTGKLDAHDTIKNRSKQQRGRRLALFANGNIVRNSVTRSSDLPLTSTSARESCRHPSWYTPTCNPFVSVRQVWYTPTCNPFIFNANSIYHNGSPLQ
jgi:hypothetical protein